MAVSNKKPVYTFKGQCATANRNAQGSNVTLARKIETTSQGQQTAREVVVVTSMDKALASLFDVMEGSYTVEIYKD